MISIKEALTFDDVTLTPKYSEVPPSDVNTGIELSKRLLLKIAILSSAMDTVTEAKMAIAKAKAGGIAKALADRYFQKIQKNASKYVPEGVEGVEGLVRFKGNVDKIIYKLIGGLKSSMGYLGSKNVINLKKNKICKNHKSSIL